MKIFVGQMLIAIVLTELSLIFPVQIYSITHSVLLLGIVTTIYNALNALGSYVWGNVLDGIERRFELILLLPLSILAISPLMFSTNTIAAILAYGLLGFFSALDSPLYSILILENFSLEDAPKANSRLSQMSLMGNIVGSILASFNPNLRVLLIILVCSFVSGMIFNRNLRGQVNKSKIERNRDLKSLNNALISFFTFNFAAEIFFTLYIPLNSLMKNPEYLIFVSYAILYAIDELMYSISVKLVKNAEVYYIYFAILMRNIISLAVSFIVLAKINVGIGTMPIFLSFGAMYPIYSTSFFSLIFRGLKRNRGTIIGVFNSFGDVANILGSLIAGFVGENKLWSAFIVSFYTFTLSAFLMSRHLKNSVSSKS